MAEKRAKRGGARPNAGRQQVHTPGKQSSVWLGTGEEPARVREWFHEERRRMGFKHSHQFMAHLLQLSAHQNSW